MRQTNIKTYIVPFILLGILLASSLYLVADRFFHRDVRILLEKEIKGLKTKPETHEIRNYTEAVNEVVEYASRCMAAADETGICRDSNALDLVRALKISDSIYFKTRKFKTSPFQFFERKLALRMGIDDLKCRLENKKPVCQVVRS